MEAKFSAVEAIGFAWHAVTAKIGKFVGLALLLFLLNIMTGFFAIVLKDMHLLSAVLNIAVYLVSTMLMVGFFRICLRIVDQKDFEIIDVIVSDISLLLKVIAINVILGLMIGLGFLLLFIPGIFLALKYGLSFLYIIDRNDPVIESIKICGDDTTGSKMELFLLGLLMIGINFVGLLCLGVGLFVSLPMSYVALAYAYRKIASPALATQPADSF
ncbi:MAG: hypothetical protein KDK51_06345 [Deltaproteobacteria bacterium]|nr:hypothetical protein [Deltaproteobacteria bacterium]